MRAFADSQKGKERDRKKMDHKREGDKSARAREKEGHNHLRLFMKVAVLYLLGEIKKEK